MFVTLSVFKKGSWWYCQLIESYKQEPAKRWQKGVRKALCYPHFPSPIQGATSGKITAIGALVLRLMWASLEKNTINHCRPSPPAGKHFVSTEGLLQVSPDLTLFQPTSWTGGCYICSPWRPAASLCLNQRLCSWG